MRGQSLKNKRSLVRLSCPSASQVPRRRAVDGYINDLDSNWPIITSNTPKVWSLITERGGGYKMGKTWVQKLFAPPPQDRVKLFVPPLL